MLFHRHFYCDSFTREEDCIQNLLCTKRTFGNYWAFAVFHGPDLIANLSDGLKIWTQVKSPVTKLANCFLSYFGNIWSSFLAILTCCFFCSSVNRCGTHVAEFFLTFKCFFKIRWTIDSDVPTFRAISGTVNLASPSIISFILEMISLWDADFSLPDFGTFLMDSTPDSNFFSTPKLCHKTHKKVSKNNKVLSKLGS